MAYPMGKRKKTVTLIILVLVLAATLPVNNQRDSLLGILFNFTLRGCAETIILVLRQLLCRYDLQYTWIYDYLTRLQIWINPAVYGII